MLEEPLYHGQERFLLGGRPSSCGSMNSYTGNLPGSGKTITASAQCIVYDHKRELVYVSTYDRHLARDIVRTQTVRDPDGEYRAYELIDEDWREIRTRVKVPMPIAPPFFH